MFDIKATIHLTTGEKIYADKEFSKVIYDRINSNQISATSMITFEDIKTTVPMSSVAKITWD